MGGFGVSDKEATKKSSNANTSSSVFGLGTVKKVQSFEAFPNTKMRMNMMPQQHHNHHHRSLSSPFGNDSFVAGDGDGDGPTTAYLSFTNHNHNINFVSGASASALGAAAATIDGGGAAVIRPLQQPFDISSAYYTSATTTTLKSPAGVMAASLGYPFTNAQWKELERQAMIYKYMMASVPVPPDLLITPPPPPMMEGHGGGGFNLRLSSSSTDPEPGRCKRTDGKKWRCSRDVAPNHKYCERHMHRGRPRSRKPVEVVLHNNNNNNNNNNNVNDHQIKRARHDCNNPFPPMAATTRKDGSSSNFLASTTCQPYLESSLSLHNNSCFGVKTSNFDSVASVSSNKQQPRGLEWMLNGDPISLGASSDSEWHSLMHNKVAMTTGRSYNNNTDPPQYLNSLALYSSGWYQQDKRLPLFLNPLVVPMESLQPGKPRGFIDAWSNTEAGESNNNKNNSAASSSIGNKLSLSSSLDLSMGGGGSTIGMGLGLMEPDDGNTQHHHHHHNDDDDDTTKISLFSNWLNPAAPCWVQAPSSTPGGPLAEVLRPSTVTATTTSDDPETMVSSPSGVLHKKLASLSDSSDNSSPTTVASSRGQF